MKHIIFSLLFVGLSCMGNGQTLEHKDIRSLADKFTKAVSNGDIDRNPDRPAEYVECFLEVDSTGKISGIRILADQTNLGPLYTSLSKIPLSVFDGWQTVKAKNRTIIIPFVYIPHKGLPRYITDLIKLRGGGDPYFTIDRETATTISLTTHFFWQRFFNQELHTNPSYEVKGK